MAIRKSLQAQLSAIPDGEVFTLSDITVPRQYQGALAKALSQFAAAGDLRRVSKGRYYKPRQSRFGELSPGMEQMAKEYLVKNGEVIGYLTGPESFSALGLTTQVSGDIMIGTNKYRRPMRCGEHKMSFLQQPNPIKEKDIPLLRILDSIRLLKSIPASTPDESIVQLLVIISKLDSKRRNRLVELVRPYPPFVRALLGAILDAQGLPTGNLEETLNPITTYKIPISVLTLPTKQQWNIQ